MSLPQSFHKAGTSLRATNAVLQAVDAPDYTTGEQASVVEMKKSAAEVVQRLDAFGAGVPQPAVAGPILSTAGIMDGSGFSIAKDYKALDDLIESDLPAGRFDEFNELRSRIRELTATVALAARR